MKKKNGRPQKKIQNGRPQKKIKMEDKQKKIKMLDNQQKIKMENPKNTKLPTKIRMEDDQRKFKIEDLLFTHFGDIQEANFLEPSYFGILFKLINLYES